MTETKKKRRGVVKPITPGSTLGANIEGERQAAGMSTRALGELAGIPQSSIQYVIAGRITNPSMDFMYAIATALGVRMEDLMGVPRVEATTRYRSRARTGRHVTKPVAVENE